MAKSNYLIKAANARNAAGNYSTARASEPKAIIVEDSREKRLEYLCRKALGAFTDAVVRKPQDPVYDASRKLVDLTFQSSESSSPIVKEAVSLCVYLALGNALMSYKKSKA